VLWLDYQQRLPTAREVARWFRRWPDANVAVVTGAVSGLVVLDVDVRHGGADSLAQLEARYGPLPRTVEAITGGGGRHLYFAHPGGVLHNKVGIRPGLDLRGDGGYVVAPPSLHPSGTRYQWKPGCSPADLSPAPMPGWLLREAAGRDGRTGRSRTQWRELVNRGVGEGERNNTIASLAGHLLWHGVDPVVVLDLLLAWNATHCRPPLTDDEVARTVESIARTHERQEGQDQRRSPGSEV
jgi:hypothetical protein